MRQLLFGLDASTLDDVLEKIDAHEARSADRHDEVLESIDDLHALVQRQFTSLFQHIQKLPETRCPNIFVLRPVDTTTWKKRLVGQKIELHLYCQAPGHWHPTQEGGRYTIEDPAPWIQQVAPYLNGLNKVLKYVMPLVGPWVGMNWPDYEKFVKHHIKMMGELVKKLPEFEKLTDLELAREIGRSADPTQAGGAALRAVRALLDEKDPRHHWGGLDLVFTPEGHHLWLCEHHKAEYT